MRVITGYKMKGGEAGNDATADEFNRFYNRFDSTPPSLTPSGCSTSADPPPECYFTEDEVRAELRKVRAGKSAGPDGITPRLLKDCASELAGPLCTIFNMSLKTGHVPARWKTSCLVPVPKVPRPTGMKDYRPVALTSVIMRTLERLLLRLLRPQVEQALDPLQFGYQENMGVDDAVIFMLHQSLSFLERTGRYVRLMFFDFTSAFNTIQPHLLKGKLERMGVEPTFIG